MTDLEQQIRDAAEKVNGIALEELAWTCECGTPMGLEVPRKGAWLDLDCRHCGIVASVSIRLKPPRPVYCESPIPGDERERKENAHE